MRRLTIVASMLVLPLALAGCKLMHPGHASCHERQPYEAAHSVAPLHAAEGLAPPNARNALKIPDLPADVVARPRGAHDSCLDEPPNFYPDRPKPGAGKS